MTRDMQAQTGLMPSLWRNAANGFKLLQRESSEQMLMQRFSVGLRSLLYVLLMFPSLMFAQQRAKVQFRTLQLTQEKAGWRVSFPDHSPSAFALQDGDLVQNIDDRKAADLGPLAIAAYLDDGAVRAFPMQVERRGQTANVVFYTADGAVPTVKKATVTLRVASGLTAPDFQLKALDGHVVHLHDYHGSWILVNFWATWCGPCQLEAPMLSRLAREYARQLHVIAIAVQDEHEKIGTFSARTNPAYEILESGNLTSTLALEYGVNNGMGSAAVPYSVLIRPDGTIAYVQGGYEEQSPLERQVSNFLGIKRK